MIPKGVATLLPAETYRRRQIEREILSSFNQWGYQEVIPPIFEYLDVFSRGVGEERLDGAYKLVDRATGRIMLLRPDVTPQVARIAATLLHDQDRPLRLCYSANVFRHEEEHAGRERELFQIGGELIGPSDAEADAEMICLCIEILRRLGLKGFKVTIGQMSYTRGLLTPFISSPPFFRRILHAIAKKEASVLREDLKREHVDERRRRQILSLLDLFGGEEVFKMAAALTDHPFCQSGLKRLREVHAILKSAGYQNYLLIDLGEVRGFDYYTGTIFEIVADGLGSELGGGGRYDHLLEKFGTPSSSTGFALYIEKIQSALEHSSKTHPCYPMVDLMILHIPQKRKQAMAFARQLRNADFRVIRNSQEQMDPMDSLLEKARQQRIKRMVVIPESASQKELQLIDVQTGECQTKDRDGVIAWLRPNRSN